MSDETLTATEAVRRFSEILNLVRYQGKSFEIVRGKEPVARMVGVHRATSDKIRTRRSAFVEALIARLPALDFTAEVVQLHAEIFAALSVKGKLIGAHDLLIAGFHALPQHHSHIRTPSPRGELRDAGCEDRISTRLRPSGP